MQATTFFLRAGLPVLLLSLWGAPMSVAAEEQPRLVVPGGKASVLRPAKGFRQRVATPRAGEWVANFEDSELGARLQVRVFRVRPGTGIHATFVQAVDAALRYQDAQAVGLQQIKKDPVLGTPAREVLFDAVFRGEAQRGRARLIGAGPEAWVLAFGVRMSGATEGATRAIDTFVQSLEPDSPQFDDMEFQDESAFLSELHNDGRGTVVLQRDVEAVALALQAAWPLHLASGDLHELHRALLRDLRAGDAKHAAGTQQTGAYILSLEDKPDAERLVGLVKVGTRILDALRLRAKATPKAKQPVLDLFEAAQKQPFGQGGTPTATDLRAVTERAAWLAARAAGVRLHNPGADSPEDLRRQALKARWDTRKPEHPLDWPGAAAHWRQIVRAWPRASADVRFRWRRLLLNHLEPEAKPTWQSVKTPIELKRRMDAVAGTSRGATLYGRALGLDAKQTAELLDVLAPKEQRKTLPLGP